MNKATKYFTWAIIGIAAIGVIWSLAHISGLIDADADKTPKQEGDQR